MSETARRDDLWQQLEELRRRPERPQLTEVATLAVAAGLSPAEALEAVLTFSERRQGRSSDLTKALLTFAASVCRPRQGGADVLEYTCLPVLLTANLLDGPEGTPVSVIAENAQLRDVIRVILGDRGGLVLDAREAIEQQARYAAIVCTPPLGTRSGSTKGADRFGGEVALGLAPYLTEDGTLLWVTARGALSNEKARQSLESLEERGLYVHARLDTAPGAFPGTLLEGAVVALRPEKPAKVFVATLRDLETAEPTAQAFLNGPSRNSGPNWTWLEPDDDRAFSELEQARLLNKLIPRGRLAMQPLSSLLLTQDIQRADRELRIEGGSFLFVPEYAGSRVTAELDEQTVKPKAVYRVVIDPLKANARFLAQVLNSPYGRNLRAAAATGATIQRLSAKKLPGLQIPVPDLKTQERIARIDGDIGLLRAAFTEMQETIEQDWNSLAEIAEKIDALKGVLDIERRIADWWQELPYPLATLYRRYQVSKDARERLETVLHFFEMAAVYLAAMGTSFVRALRPDWEEVAAKWLHPQGGAGIERADFGFWAGLAATSLKDLNRIASDKELRAAAVEKAGHELVQVAATAGRLGRATESLDVARRYRNSWKGHGGHLKRSDAARLGEELQQPIRDLYEVTAPILRSILLVRPGNAEILDAGFKSEIDLLCGSDPTFEKDVVELDRPAVSNALGFWMRDARTVCRALPFFRLGAPQQPEETSCYVFNRVEDGGLRWISYQESREQEFVAPDEELLGLISLGREAG